MTSCHIHTKKLSFKETKRILKGVEQGVSMNWSLEVVNLGWNFALKNKYL